MWLFVAGSASSKSNYLLPAPCIYIVVKKEDVAVVVVVVVVKKEEAAVDV